MSGAFRLTPGTGLRGVPGRPGPFLLGGLALDGLPASAAAYSVRRLRTAYTGPALRVRRSSDNAELDIGFTAAGDLDTTALLLHAGENLFVQSGGLPTSWGVNGLAVSAAGTGIQDQPAFFLEDTATTGNHYVFQSRTYTPGAQQVVSFDVRDNGRGFAHFLFNAQISGFAANIDLSTGATNIVNGAGTGTITATSLGSGWWRVDVGITVGSGGLGSAYVGGASSLAMIRNGAYAGAVGQGILVSRPQIVNGSAVKSYARTDSVALDGNGFAVTWYDQSGNARHATQATAGNQPQIVNAGVPEQIGGRAAPTANGTSMFLTAPSASYGTSMSVVAAVIPLTLDGGTRMWLATVGINALVKVGVSGANDFYRLGGATLSRPGTYVNGQGTVRAYVVAPGAQAAFRDGLADGTGAAGVAAVTGELSLLAAASDGQRWHGRLGELVFFASAIGPAQRQALERSQGSYFGITVA